jgi:hypothetical protein
MKQSESVIPGYISGPWYGMVLRSAVVLSLLSMWVLPNFAHAKEPPASGMTTELHFELPLDLQDEQSLYQADVTTAILHVLRFFQSAGLFPDSGHLIDSVVVFNTHTEARQYLAATFGGKPEDIPETFAGTVLERSLYLVSRQSYQEIWKQLYSEWPWTDSTYLQLIEHELAHRAHESIAISALGSPDAMGPSWFFEGLAIVCAHQFMSGEPLLSKAQIEQQLESDSTPTVMYPMFGRLVRSVLAQSDLKSTLLRAAEPGFPMVLWKDDSASTGR